MADPVGGVEKIVKLALKIKEAVETARRNKEECQEIEKRVARVSALLVRMQQATAGVMDDDTVISDALEDLAESLDSALRHVTACQERASMCLLCMAGDLSRQLRRVQDDISHKMMLGVFAMNVQVTIVLATNPPPATQTLVQAEFVSCSSQYVVPQIFRNNISVLPPPPPPPPRRTRGSIYNFFYEADGEAETELFRPYMVPAGYYAGRVCASNNQSSWRKFSSLELEGATNHFSEDNLIGRGAFAAVFKGVLRDGLVVAIKKFKHPYQLPTAHIIDVLSLVSKLHHKNIIKFIGYGYEVVEMVDGFDDNKHQAQESHYFLVEEYMPNGSLNDIIYGSRIQWTSLFRIVQGIAQGLHYLHEQQFLHSDLKPNNILLDSDRNPKITDFGTARVLDHGHDTPTRGINYIAGTVGYMPPEYIFEGILSTKYDVYSFGVMLLEIISSMCRSKPAPHQASIEWAWMARQAGQMKELLDPSLYAEFQLKDIRRCMEVGLLCTQFKPADRPAMSDVLAMLDGKKKVPTPKQPGYTKRRKA